MARFGRSRKVALAAASVAAALFVLEAGVWFTHSVIDGKPRLLRSDPELGWTNRRNFDGRRRLDDGSFWTVALDDRGRRRLDLPPRPGAPTVVALGDSFVFGDGVDTPRHFLREVGLGLPANVVNLGVVGYSTDQEWLALRRYDGPADVVLLGTYLGNDLSGNLSHSGGPLLRFKPKVVGYGEALRVIPPRHPWLNRARHGSYLVTLGLGALLRVAPDLALFDTPPAGDESAGAGEAWDRYADLVDHIVDEARRRGAGRVLVLLWSQRSSHGDPRAAELLASRYPGGGVRVIDLDREIAQSGIAPETLYHAPSVDPGGHWNAAGHAFVAGVVVDALAARPAGGAAAPQSSR